MTNMGWISNNSTSRKTNNPTKKRAEEFAARWADLGTIILREIRKGKMNSIQNHSHLESKM